MKGIETIKSPDVITTEEVFEKIKDCEFTAGKPEYQAKGILKFVKLPAVGRYCFHIVAGGKQIQISMVEDMAQTGTFMKNAAIGSKLGIFAKALDNDKAPSQELLEKTAVELKGYLGL